MESWAIFKHAVRMVLANLGDAVRVTGVPLLVPLIFIFGAAVLTSSSEPPGQQQISGLVVFLIVVGALGFVVGSLWSIVGWHRYVLLEEKPRIVPKFLASQMLAYLGKGILVGLLIIPILLVISLALGIVTGIVMAGIMSSNAADIAAHNLWKIIIATQLTSFLVSVPLYAFIYRLSPLLPAAALGVPMNISEAWSKTNGHTVTLLGVGFLTALALGILQIPQLVYFFAWADNIADAMLSQRMDWANTLGTGNPIWLDVYGIVTMWLQMIIGASILTTIYGHFVEGRSLDLA